MDLKTKKDLIDENSDLSVQSQCEIIGLSRSVYYYKPTENEVETEKKEQILKFIEELFAKRPYFGHRRIHQYLIEAGYDIGRDKVLDYMKELNIEPIYPKKKTTIVNKVHKKYPYLLKSININKPNKVWAADITYLKLPIGYCYFVGVIDWYSRKILSYEISNTMDKELCINALNKALVMHGKPDIFNTDQGSQFTSVDFTEILKKKDIKISMDSVGRWADNIIIERFFRTLKYEDFYIFKYKTMKETKIGIKEYIDFYNNERKHSSLEYKTPNESYGNLCINVA